MFHLPGIWFDGEWDQFEFKINDNENDTSLFPTLVARESDDKFVVVPDFVKVDHLLFKEKGFLLGF